MTGELRAQRREPCNRQRLRHDGWRVVPCRMAGEQAACPGCNGDGTRWVTVGTLRPPMTDDLMEKPTYVIEEYVIEEAS